MAVQSVFPAGQRVSDMRIQWTGHNLNAVLAFCPDVSFPTDRVYTLIVGGRFCEIGDLIVREDGKYRVVSSPQEDHAGINTGGRG